MVRGEDFGLGVVALLPATHLAVLLKNWDGGRALQRESVRGVRVGVRRLMLATSIEGYLSYSYIQHLKSPWHKSVCKLFIICFQQKIFCFVCKQFVDILRKK